MVLLIVAWLKHTKSKKDEDEQEGVNAKANP
jgi:hypothetical protein